MSNQPTSLSRSHKVVIINAILVGLCCFLPLDLYLPSLPHIVKSIHASTDQVQLSIALFLLGMGITQLIFGPLSDRFGRKPILMFGLAISTIGSVIIVFCHEPLWFLSGRLIEGVGAGAGVLLARTMATDILSAKNLAIIGSYISMVFSISPIAAPALGGFLQTHWGWRSNFIAMAIFQGLVLLILIISCPETNQHRNIESTRFKVVLSHYKTIFSSRIFIGFMIAAGIVISINTAYAVIAPFLIQNHFHLSAQQFGLISIILGGASLLSKFINSQLIKKLGLNRAIIISYAILIFAGLALLLVVSLNWVTLSIIIIGVSIASVSSGFMSGNAMAGALGPFRHVGGSAGAVYGSLQMAIGFLSGAILSVLPWHNTLVLSICYLCLGLLGLVLFLILVKPFQANAKQ